MNNDSLMMVYELVDYTMLKVEIIKDLLKIDDELNKLLAKYDKSIIVSRVMSNDLSLYASGEDVVISFHVSVSSYNK